MRKVFAGLTLLIAAVVLYFVVVQKLFYDNFYENSMKIRSEAGRQENKPVTETDLQGLPEPVIRYMKYTGVLGKNRISFVRLRHSGTFKPGSDKPFMPIKGEYYITTKKPSFSWYGLLKMAPGFSAAAYDSYFDGKGRMLVKVMSAFNVIDAQGEKTGSSAFGRCAAEMSMAPTFFLDKKMIKWKNTKKKSAEFTITDGKYSTTAELTVNEDGSLAAISVMRYYGDDDKTATLEKFTGKASAYKEYSGYKMPSKFDGYWNLKNGDLHYVSFIVDGVEIE